MAGASVAQITQLAIKHLETARRKPRALVHRDPMSAYILQHVRNCKLNLAAIIRGFLSCRPRRLSAGHFMARRKSIKLCVVCGKRNTRHESQG
jgi:hypothetical protein